MTHDTSTENISVLYAQKLMRVASLVFRTSNKQNIIENTKN